MALCAHFSDFSTSIFFLKFFRLFVWGPHIASKHLSTKGETLYRGFKNVLKKKPLSSKSRGFQQKTLKTGVHTDFSMDFKQFRAMDSMLQKQFFHWISHVEAMV